MRNEKWERTKTIKGEMRKGKGQRGKEKDRRKKDFPLGMTRAESLYPIVAKIL